MAAVSDPHDWYSSFTIASYVQSSDQGDCDMEEQHVITRIDTDGSARLQGLDVLTFLTYWGPLLGVR